MHAVHAPMRFGSDAEGGADCDEPPLTLDEALAIAEASECRLHRRDIDED